MKVGLRKGVTLGGRSEYMQTTHASIDSVPFPLDITGRVPSKIYTKLAARHAALTNSEHFLSNILLEPLSVCSGAARI